MEKKLGFQKVPELVLFDNVVKIYTLLGFKKTDDTNGQARSRLIEYAGKTRPVIYIELYPVHYSSGTKIIFKQKRT